jgi:penicillin-binding protein 2
LQQKDIAQLQQEKYKYPGIDIRLRTVRDYTYPIASHIFGGVGKVNNSDIEKDPYYTADDYSGREGIERTYEKQVRGVKGVEILMRDARGRIQGKFQNGELDKAAQTGVDIHLSIDRATQEIAEKLFNGKIGSLVAIEPKTGEILAMVSAPYWDPRKLVGSERSESYQELLKNKNKPLINRAIQAQYSPGSTFKILQALIGLQMGVVSPETLYPCSGRESTPIKCTHSHNNLVDLHEGIAQSCNPYFWALFRDLLQKDGYQDNHVAFKNHYETWRNMVTSFGLGARFENTDIRDQAKGYVPTIDFYNRAYGNKGWKAITIRSLAIGQGELLVTPLQLANQVAAVANKGYYITHHFNKHDSMKLNVHQTLIDEKYFDVVHQGMLEVMLTGTGKSYNVPELLICGKTGTVQNPHGKDHALFIGFAPMDNPQIAVAVAVENAGYGSTWACPIATLVMEQYLTGSINRTELFNRLASTSLIAQ